MRPPPIPLPLPLPNTFTLTLTGGSGQVLGDEESRRAYDLYVLEEEE